MEYSFKAVLFDFDGVVVDTESQYTIFWDEINEKYLPEVENLALKLKDVFLADIRLCDKYEDHFNTRNNNFFIRLWESLVRLLSPLM